MAIELRAIYTMKFIKLLCCDGLNKEVYIVNTTGCTHWKKK
jgi:hypothetical protein